MKAKTAFFLIFIGSLAFAGDKVGNGGGLWGCVIGTDLKKGELVDLYEAKEEFDLTSLVSSHSAMEIVQERADFLKNSLPDYAQLFLPYLDEVKNNLRFVDAQLTTIDDSLYPISPLPASCPSGIWSYLQFANFTGQGQVLIRKDLWNSPQISELDKSALIWHEAVYRWLRLTKGDTNSIRARHIVGILYSNQASLDMRSQINKVLGSIPPPPSNWICLLQSMSDEKIFSGTDSLRRQAEISTLQSCQKSGMQSICNQFELECDQIASNLPGYFCELQDYSTQMIYSSQGRSNVEAKIKTLTACLQGSAHGFCDSHQVKCQTTSAP